MRTNELETIRINDAVYSRPFKGHDVRTWMSVWYDDGERFVTIATPDVIRAWAEHDAAED